MVAALLNDAMQLQPSVGGLIMTKLGHIHSEGDFVQMGRYRIEVIDMDQKGIDKVLIAKIKSRQTTK